MKVLIAAPISGHKQYSINQWFEWIARQSHKDYDFILCVNGKNQYKLVSMLKQVELNDVHGQTKHPIIMWIENREGINTNILQNITHARESIRRFAVKHNYDKIFWSDTDTIPRDLNTIDLLTAHDKPAISGLYFYKKTRVPIAVSTKTGTNFTLDILEKAVIDKKLLECALWGLGCCLIDRSVFTEVTFEYKMFGKERGDDYGFCYALKERKIKRWLDPRVICHHLGKAMKNMTPVRVGK